MSWKINQPYPIITSECISSFPVAGSIAMAIPPSWAQWHLLTVPDWMEFQSVPILGVTSIHDTYGIIRSFFHIRHLTGLALLNDAWTLH